MKPKKGSGPSISEAIADLVEFGEVRNSEVAETHYQLLRQAQSNPLRNSFAVRGGKSLCLSFDRFRSRQLATGTPGQGAEWAAGTEIQAGASDLLSWSACRQLGATVLPGLAGRAQIPLVTELPEPEWLPEVGMVIPNSGDLRTDQIILAPRQTLSDSSPSAKYFQGFVGLRGIASFCRKALQIASGDLTGCVIRGDCLFAFGTLRLQAAPNKKPSETNFAGKLVWRGIQIISGEFRIMWPFPPDIDSDSSCRA